MKPLILLLSVLSILAGTAPAHAQPTSFTAEYGTDRAGQGWSPFGPKFSKRQDSVAPSNTVAPVASGTARVGQTLTTTDGTWDGTAPITYTYQWRRDGVNIGSATNSAYVLVTADLGTAIDCVVTGTNAAGAVSQDSNNITVGSDLGAVLASAVFDLDATKSASYSGTGTAWANLVTTPADSSIQTAYNYRTGDGVTSTTYPTFTGSAGAASAYFSFDGGDYFSITSGLTALLGDLHKTGGSDFTLILAFRFVQNDVEQRLFSSQNSTTTNGLTLGISSAERLFLRNRATSSAVTGTNNATTLVNGTDYLVIASHSRTANNTRWWINSLTKTDVAQTFEAGTGAAAGDGFTIGARVAGSADFVPNNTRIYGAAVFNEYVDDTKAAALIAAIEARHSRDYTP